MGNISIVSQFSILSCHPSMRGKQLLKINLNIEDKNKTNIKLLLISLHPFYFIKFYLVDVAEPTGDSYTPRPRGSIWVLRLPGPTVPTVPLWTYWFLGESPFPCIAKCINERSWFQIDFILTLLMKSGEGASTEYCALLHGASSSHKREYKEMQSKWGKCTRFLHQERYRTKYKMVCVNSPLYHFCT